MDAIDLVDIGVPWRAEHRCIAQGWSAKTMRCGISLVIGFHFDHWSSDAIDQQEEPDQVTRNFHDIAVKKRAIKLLHSCSNFLSSDGGNAPQERRPGQRTRG